MEYRRGHFDGLAEILDGRDPLADEDEDIHGQCAEQQYIDYHLAHLVGVEHGAAEEIHQRVGHIAVNALVHIGVAGEVVLVGAAHLCDDDDADNESAEDEKGHQPAEALFEGDVFGGGDIAALSLAAAEDCDQYHPQEGEDGGEACQAVDVADRPLVAFDAVRGDEQYLLAAVGDYADYELNEGRNDKKPQHKEDQQVAYHFE